MSYLREIPRDLFNESKLLKSLGRLALIIHEGYQNRWHLSAEFDESEFPAFNIEQNPDSGWLYCSNLNFYVDGKPIDLASRYDSKAAYPLIFSTESEGDDVFDDEGNLSPEFREWLDRQIETD